MKQTDAKWYATWFDTPYYHILYKHRDNEEAHKFMRNLTAFLNLKPDAHILDVACGRGRHAIYLNSIGYTVTGIDLSENNIKHAKDYGNETLSFIKHDMCHPMKDNYDAVFNLFTSFGYFEKEEDNVRAISSMSKNMKAKGCGVIDFLNLNHTLKNMVTHEQKQIDGITFKITKHIENGFLYKNINFEADGKTLHFTERLKCIYLETFKKYFETAGLSITHLFGNYDMDNYNAETSDRLIMIFQKK